jgi:hypothetical protein
MKNHTDLLNYLVQTFNLQSYLEIGVQNPENNFDKIKCETKIGVDPAIGRNGQIFKMESDTFFEINDFNRREDNGGEYKLDLVLIDGLHHADQVRRDFENSLKCLNDNGFIVIHDTLPEKEETTHVPRSSKVWHGNVYQFAMTLGEYREIDFMTVNIDCGCTVVWKDSDKRGFKISYPKTWYTYSHLKNEILRIRSAKDFKEKIASIFVS